VGLRLSRLFPIVLVFSSTAFALPQLRLSQTVVGPLSVAQGADTAAVVEAANVGDGNLNVQVASSVPWLTARAGALRDCALRLQACTPLEITVRSSTLARGTHTGVLTVSDPNALDAPQTITVTVNVGGTVPERADLYVAPNGSTAALRFTSTSQLQTSAATTSGGQWLAVGLEGGGSFRFGQPNPYRIAVTHLPGMAEGTYNGTVTVAGSSIAADNRSVPVTVRVTSQPIAQLSTERVNFRLAPNTARQQQFIAVTNRGLGTLSLTGATAATTSGGNWLTAERVENQNLVSVAANPSGLSPGSYAGTVRIASNAAQGEIVVPVQLDVIAAGPPVAFYQGVVNNATFEAGDVLAQGAIVALFGEQLTTGEARVAQALPLTSDLGSVRVLVNDQPAPVYYVSYHQINFQIPYNAAPGDATIRVEREGQRGNAISARIAASVPRLLRLGIGDYAIAVNQDGSFPIPATTGVNSRPARPGETLVFYAIGLGPTTPSVQSGAGSPSSPLAQAAGAWRVAFGFSGPFGVGTVEAMPMFVGLTPNFVGLYQINVTIPEDAPRGTAVPVALIGESGPSNRVTIAVQ
jgi:uncharacterized protein (TIGR03437 family)